MKPYPKYKDSGVEWIGNVPEGWEVKRTKYFFRLITEKNSTIETKKVALENIESWTGRFIDSEVDYQGEGISFLKGDVLFGKLRPYLAKVLNAKFSGASVGDIFVMRPKLGISSRFSFYRFLSKPFIDIVNGSTFGAKMPRASWNFIANLYIAVPDYDEQGAIATYLNRKTTQIDDLISKKQKLIELLKEERAAIINQAVTKGLNPDAPMKDSGVEWIREVPAHWEIMRLKYVSIIISKGTTPSTIGKNINTRGDIRFIKAENIENNELKPKPEFFVDEETNDILKRSQLEKYDVLFVIAGATIGKVAVLTDEFLPANTNQAISFIRLKRYVNVKFIWYWLQSSRINELTWLNAVQSAQPNLAMENLGNFCVTHPPVSEQDAIVFQIESETTKIDQTISKIEKQIELLKEYRTALISEVVTGKIDVRDGGSNG